MRRGVLLASLLLCASHGSGTELDLSGPWRFQVGDRAHWADAGFDDSSWPVVDLPTGWGRSSPLGELAWYRRSVVVDPEAASTPPGLAVLVGNVDSAYELYAGGVLLGGVGSFPPDARIDYDRHGLYVIPPEAVGSEGRLLLALRVWKSPQTDSSIGGPVEAPLRLGPTLELERETTRREILRLFVAGVFILVGLYHLQVFHRRTSQREYLWYAAVAIGAGVYSLLLTQWKYALTDRFVLLKELEYAVIMILPALLIQFLWSLLDRPITFPLRAYQAWTVGLALVVSLTPGLGLNMRILPYWQATLVLLMVATVAVVLVEAWRGHPEARILAAALALLLVIAVYDVAVDRGILQPPRLAPFGFATFVLAMAITLANRFGRAQAELATLHRELERRVEQRTAELARKTAEASAASEAKSRFLATMSHEVRTPLNAVIGMTELLLGTQLSPEQRQSLQVVHRSGEGLLDLVNDVLDFTRIDSDNLVLERQPFSPRACVEEALELVVARAAEKRLDLAYVAAPDVPAAVIGDVRRVRQVLVNLVGNAVKFTPSGGVLVRVQHWDRSNGSEGLHVSVADTGRGIAADQRDQLFQVFSQLDASHSREHEGTGLGLAISRRLCELMGGRIWLGEEPGPGSVFHVELPAAAAEERGGSEAREPLLEGRTALVVSPGPFTRLALEASLSEWRMAAELASSVPEAEERLRRGGIDVVLLGLGPRGSGPEVLPRLRGPGAQGSPPWLGFGPPPVGEAVAAPPELSAHVAIPIRPALLRAALVEALRGPAPSARTHEPAPRRTPVPAAPLRILLAEDNVVNQRVALGLLRREGYTADTVANGVEALEALRRKPYDVVLLDVQMPEMDGLETARRIREEWDPGPWLIAVTASALHGDREACLEAGMDDYVAKPIRSGTLVAALERRRAARHGRQDESAAPPGSDVEVATLLRKRE